MNNITITWIALPLFMGFIIYLIPKIDRLLAIGVTLVSAAYALQVIINQQSLTLQLLDNFGVTLAVDQLSGYFILTNALVSTAVILYCWNTGKTSFFYMQMMFLHGSLNSAFICTDFLSLYVALEVIGIASFLLITYPRSDRSIWVGLRYLFISNTAMLFYLVGTLMVYQANNSFAFGGLQGSPIEAQALILMGLLTKAGIFVSGLWLPLTHSESESPVSALLSGVVVKAGVYPLLRCALLVEEIDPVIRIFGVATALLGAFYAIFEKDTKRTLALSTLSQLGFILSAPAVGGLYALGHGLVKATIFLIAGILPSRNFQELKHRPINRLLWIVLLIASLSVSGFPLLIGFGAKMLTMKNLQSWQEIVMNVAAVGTAIVYAKFIFLPNNGQDKVRTGFWPAAVLLLGAMIVANVAYLDAYTVANISKAIATMGGGWLVYFLIFRRGEFKVPPALEKFEHLVGGMSLMLVVLFWMIWANTAQLNVFAG